MPGGDQLVAFTRILHRTRPDVLMDEVCLAIWQSLAGKYRGRERQRQVERQTTGWRYGPMLGVQVWHTQATRSGYIADK